MTAQLCLTYTGRALAALEPVHNDEKCAEKKLSQGGSQDADTKDADADAASLPTTINNFYEDAASTTKPLARAPQSGRATRGSNRRQGRRVLVVRLRRVGRGHGFCRWFNTIDKIRLKHDGLEAAGGFTTYKPS